MVRKVNLVIHTALFLLLLSSTSMAFQCDVTASSISFGSYDIFSSTPKDTVGTVRVSCNIPAQNPHAPLMVTVSLSQGMSGNIGQRQLESAGGGRLNYNLYSNSSFSNIWGDGGSFAAQTAFITKETPYNATIYSRIPAKQNVPVGSYSDVITVTILW
jgi:spore coat protein U-like protein